MQSGDPWNLGVSFLFRPEHIIMQIKSCHWSSEILTNTCTLELDRKGKMDCDVCAVVCFPANFPSEFIIQIVNFKETYRSWGVGYLSFQILCFGHKVSSISFYLWEFCMSPSVTATGGKAGRTGQAGVGSPHISS